MPINPVHLALTNDGKVLIIAGSGNVASEQNFRGAVWDPQLDTLSTHLLSYDMFCSGMVTLPDGRVLINGGNLRYDPFWGEPQNAAYDPASGQYTNLENMAHGRWYPTTTVLGDGRVMTFSGLKETGGTNSTVEIYTVGAGWSQEYPAGWTPPLYPRMHLLTNGTVFYSGSGRGSRIFNPSTNAWSPVVATTNYTSSRTYGTSVLLPLSPADGYRSRVMILGGGNPATATTEIIEPLASSPAWQYGPPMSQSRIQMNATILPNGKVLAVGGSLNDEDAQTASLNADIYDPGTNSFSPGAPNMFPRLYHSVSLLLSDGRVLLAGGNPVRGSYETSMEIYSPAYLFKANGSAAVRPTITDVPLGPIGYNNSFEVHTPDAGNIASVALLRPGAPTHAFDMDQRMVWLSYTSAAGVLNVTSPPNGNVAPPGYYMLFILNAAGVPSVARFVHLSDFALSATPVSQTVLSGSSTSYTATVTGDAGFGGTVHFSVSGLPSGATASFTPQSVSNSGATTLNVTTSPSVAPGSYPLTITGTSGPITHTASVTLHVSGSPSISATPTVQTIARGKTATYTVTAGGFSGVISFSASGAPAKAPTRFSPPSVMNAGSSHLAVKVNASAKRGPYTLTIRGTSGSEVKTATVTLTVQ